MLFKKILIWSHVIGFYHTSLKNEDKTIAASIPILTALFPEINFYSITGFSSLMSLYGVPALRKLFPELLELSTKEVLESEMVEVKEFLPSKGYEWQDDPNWKVQFDNILLS